MSEKRTIAIDIDDVMSDTNESVRVWANSVSGAKLEPSHYKIKSDYWGYYERVWALNNMDSVDFLDFEESFVNDQIDSPLLPGALYAIKQLKQNFKVIFVTSRNPKCEAITRKWFRQNLGEDIDLYFARNGRTGVGESKGVICKDLGAFMLIDDNYNHCKDAIDNGLEAVLFGDYGWHSDEQKKNIVNCRDWPKVLEYLDELK